MKIIINKIIHTSNFNKTQFSYGISCYPHDGSALNELIKKADERLYQMKESKKQLAGKKQTEFLLIESEKRYKRLLKFLPEPIIVHSEGTILYANRAAVHLVKAKTKSELIGKSLYSFLHPENHKDVSKIIQQVMLDNEASNFKPRSIYCITGELIETEASTIRVDIFDDNPVILSVFRDITERKNAEELLIQS